VSDDQKASLANKAINAKEVLPDDLSKAAWDKLNEVLNDLHSAVVDSVNAGADVFKDLEGMVADLVKNVGNLAGKAETGAEDELHHERDGAEIATVLNAVRALPDYIASK
jgi:hypothetical protein